MIGLKISRAFHFRQQRGNQNDRCSIAKLRNHLLGKIISYKIKKLWSRTGIVVYFISRYKAFNDKLSIMKTKVQSPKHIFPAKYKPNENKFSQKRIFLLRSLRQNGKWSEHRQEAVAQRNNLPKEDNRQLCNCKDEFNELLRWKKFSSTVTKC